MKPFLDLGPGECRWPAARLGGVQQFCAEPVDAARVYCAAHHALAVPHGAPVQVPRRPPSPFWWADEPVIPWIVNRPYGADLSDVMGGKPPRKPTAVVGRQGKRVDEEGFETADREPDLCELFEGAR